MYGSLLSGVMPAIRSNFSLMLLSSAIPSLIRQYQSTMARNIKNNAIQIAAATATPMSPFPMIFLRCIFALYLALIPLFEQITHVSRV
jgi:hypothetical protein